MRQQPRSGSTPGPGQPWVFFLPGGFPNKVREGEVPVIVQPRFHRVVVPRPRGARALPLHAGAARLCASLGLVPLAGVSPSSSGLGLETLPRASLGSGGLWRAARAPGQPAAPPRLFESGLQVPRAGPGPQPRLRGSRPDRLLRPLDSPIPRRPRRQLASSPEAGLPRPEGSTRPLGCAARREGSGSRGGDGCVRECPCLGKGRSRHGDPSPAQRAVARGRFPERERWCHPGRFFWGPREQ